MALIETNVRLPKRMDWTRCAQSIERAIAAAGLRVTMKAELRAYPGATHWHLKRGREAGTLEVTMWPAGSRVWCSVQAGRRAAWIEDVLPSLIPALEGALHLPADGAIDNATAQSPAAPPRVCSTSIRIRKTKSPSP
jgi:hypothetical protein